MYPPYVIPSSRSSHWRSALDRTAGWANRCSPGHPLLYWRAQAESLLAQRATPTSVDEVVEQLLVPATYLCRLAHSLTVLAPTGDAYDSELGHALNEPGSFLAFEHVLHLGSRIKWSGHDIAFAGLGSRKAPDLIVPAARVAIEARARGLAGARKPLRKDFDHAEAKFEEEFSRVDRSGWVGILAVDLGVCGTPSMPNVARLGPELGATEADLDDELAIARRVGGAVITWVGPASHRDGDVTNIGMTSCSGWRMSAGYPAPSPIAAAFDPWERNAREVAWRTAPDKPADLRR